MLNICAKAAKKSRNANVLCYFPSYHKEVLRRKKPKVQKISDLFLPF